MAIPEKIPAAALIAERAMVVHPAAAPPAAATPAPPAPKTPQPPPMSLLPFTAAQAPHPAVPPKTPPLSVAILSTNNLRRTLATVDPLGTAAVGHEVALNPFRLAAGAKVFGGLKQIVHHVGLVIDTLKQPKLPPKLIGALHQPDGPAAVRVQVQFQPSSVGGTGPIEVVLTADDGGFTLKMPTGATMPEGGLTLTVHGASSNTTVNVPAAQIAANGMIGVITLPVNISPLPVSILAALQALVPTAATPKVPSPQAPDKKHCVTIGEAGSTCIQTFSASQTVDRFPWGLFFRIVEPQMSIATQTQEFALANQRFSWMPIFATETKASSAVSSKFVDRVPVDQPLSVDGFRDQVSGIDHTGHFTEDETVPMAASLGLGYVLRMAQQWTLQGLGLGDLVYSLPLAPGEQQQVAVFERQDTSAVQESEFFSQSEVMNQAAMSDTSTTATFNSAFKEMVNGSSAFSTDSTSASAGLSFGIGPIGFGGGGGSSSSSGNSSSSLAGSRDTTSQAAQATHSSAETHAAARVTANRTGMRLATGTESMGVTTKTITNHNHTHALTMQYWQVLRMYDVTTTIEGLTLVCLVPMQIVRFMPPGQSASLSDPSSVDSHAKVLARYGNILRHLDVLMRYVPRQFRHGLNLLAQLAADPTTVVDPAGTSAETVITFRLQGNFLSCEKVSIVAVTNRNTRIGPVQLGPSVAGQPTPIPPDTFMTRDELIAWLARERQINGTTLAASLALPPSINRSDIIGFEISRQFITLRYTLTSAAKQAAEQMLSQDLHGQPINISPQSFGALITGAGLNPPTITLGPGDLEPLLGGPTVGNFYAAVENFNQSGNDVPSPQETYANDNLAGTVLPPQPFPVPALQIAPVLRYQDVLEIEKAAQHVVRNTTRYSKYLWLSMSQEETAILLDGYTIGVPADGLADASQMIPLLNCLQNVILGVFGNSLIMPFIIPQDLAEQLGLDPAQLQQALLAYQKEGFEPPHSLVALPTRGVLGEAVLGHCSSAEKIDLTRFWNWQDAPSDTAPGIGMVQLPTTTPPLTTGVTAPNSLTNLPPLINNLITAPQPNTSLLTAMGQQAASQQDFNPSFTGQQQLASLMQNGQNLANQARSDALKTSQAMAIQSMNTMAQMAGMAMNAGGQAPGGQGGGGAKTPATTPATQPAGGTQAKPATGGKGGGAAKPGTTSAPTAGAATPAADATGAAAGGDAAGAAVGGDAAGAAGGAAAGDAAAGGGAMDAVASILPLLAAL